MSIFEMMFNLTLRSYAHTTDQMSVFHPSQTSSPSVRFRPEQTFSSPSSNVR